MNTTQARTARRARRRARRATLRTMRRPVRPVMLTLADGTSRPAQRVKVGDVHTDGIVCPWCEYPSAGTSCGNPVCVAGMDAERLSAHRAREAERTEARRRSEALSASLDRSRQEAEAREAERRRDLRAQAEAGGKCMPCLDRSLRRGGAPKLIAHKSEANCPEARTYAG